VEAHGFLIGRVRPRLPHCFDFRQKPALREGAQANVEIFCPIVAQAAQLLRQLVTVLLRRSRHGSRSLSRTPTRPLRQKTLSHGTRQ
jgi:hypothetical protein